MTTLADIELDTEPALLAECNRFMDYINN